MKRKASTLIIFSFFCVELILTSFIHIGYALGEAWVSPDDNYNPGGWTNPQNAYDENTTTYALYETYIVGWFPYIYLNWTSSVPRTNKLRYWIDTNVVISWSSQIDLYNGTWTPISMYDIAGQWVNVSFSEITNVVACRCRFYNINPSSYTWAKIYEVDLLNIAVNQAPTTGEFQAPATAYANQYFFLNHTIQDVDGNTTFINSTLTVVNGTSTFKWVNSTNTFSEDSDSSNYWTLDAGNSLRVYVNATSFRLCYKLKAYWNFTEGAISVNATVFDDGGLNGTAVSNGLFTFEDDLIVQSALLNNYANPASSITMDALLHYQGTATVPEDAAGIIGYVELGGVVKGFDTSINATGYFTVTFNSEGTLSKTRLSGTGLTRSRSR
jgi:hypothetical protein